MIVTEAFMLPENVGSKVTETLHWAPGLTEVPQVLL